MEDGHEPATRRDVAQLRTEVQQDAQLLRSEFHLLRSEVQQLQSKVELDIEQLRTEFQHGFDDLKETMRDGQTELLKAFYSYAQGNDERMAAGDHESASFKKRLATLKFRVTEVEKRLNMPQ